MKKIEKKEHRKVLDVGCGSGLLADMLSGLSNTEVVAIDANKEAIAFARNKFNKPNLVFKLGLLDDIVLPEQSFDAIFFLEVIEHITYEQAKFVLKYFIKLLKPEGQLIITTPNRRSMWPLIEWILDKTKLVPTMAEEQHEHLYSYDELKQLIESMGFSPTKIKTINTISPWASLLSWNFALKIASMESKLNIKWGSIILGSFKKA